MNRLLPATAALAMLIAVARATTQSITMDEAATYLLFAHPDHPFYAVGSANNHVLNTLLMRLSTETFGLSEFSARLPALLGAALYISACHRLIAGLSGAASLRWLALACLLFDPFLMDYFAAARGYALALGFLMTALTLSQRTPGECALASACSGLCFASNFSFAFACAAALTGLFLRRWRENTLPRLPLLAAYVLPALATAAAIAGPSLLALPPGELWYGARNLAETARSIAKAQGSWIPLGSLAVGAVACTGARIPSMAVFFAAILAATLGLHAAAHHLGGLLYPLDRTGAFLIPIAIAGLAAAAVETSSWRRIAVTTAFLATAASHAASQRFTYFENWKYNSRTRELFRTVTCLHESHGVSRIAASWSFQGPLNFYRLASPAGALPEITSEQNSPDPEIVVYDEWQLPKVRDGLVTLWKGEPSAVIGAPPGHAPRLRASPCFN